MATASSSPVDRLLARYPPGVQTLANSARRLVPRLLPRAAETVDLSSGIVAYSYGPGYKGMVCTLILSKAGVKIGLVRGSELGRSHINRSICISTTPSRSHTMRWPVSRKPFRS